MPRYDSKMGKILSVRPKQPFNPPSSRSQLLNHSTLDWDSKRENLGSLGTSMVMCQAHSLAVTSRPFLNISFRGVSTICTAQGLVSSPGCKFGLDKTGRSQGVKPRGQWPGARRATAAQAAPPRCLVPGTRLPSPEQRRETLCTSSSRHSR